MQLTITNITILKSFRSLRKFSYVSKTEICSCQEAK
jgi:hypothetical protein